MIAFAIAALFQSVQPAEVLPIDNIMAAVEVAIPRLRQVERETEADIGRLGAMEPGWAWSGLSAVAAIEDSDGNPAGHVLGEWEKGGHGVVADGRHPLAIPAGFRRYTVRAHDGPVDLHSYFRVGPGLVLHVFGQRPRIGSAECYSRQGIELIARDAWQDWSEETIVVAVGLSRAARDDPRTYCTLYRRTASGGFAQRSYSEDGRPYIISIEEAQTFVVTPHAEAAARMFGDRSAE